MQIKRTSGSLQDRFEDRCFAALFILFLLMGAFLLKPHTVSAAAIYCDNPSPHCYAEVSWIGTAHGGGATNLSPYGSMSCSGCSGFIDNEMWLEDTNSSSCVLTSWGDCEVEAGIETRPAGSSYDCNPGYDSTCLFWADYRYDGVFHHHALYTVGSYGVDLNPWYFPVAIRNNSNNSASGNTWSIAVNGNENGNSVVYVTGTSTNNNMTPNELTIGSELDTGSGGTPSAGEMDFDYNEWLDSSGVWHYRTATPVNTSTDGPPYGWWTQYPNSSNGGNWSTDCC